LPHRQDTAELDAGYIFVTQFDYALQPIGATSFTSINTDSWDGYAISRLQILGLIPGQVSGNPIRNCVFLTGDIHSTYACDIPANPTGYNPATSLSSHSPEPSSIMVAGLGLIASLRRHGIV